MIKTSGPASRNEDELVLRTNYRISHPERLANGNSRSQLGFKKLLVPMDNYMDTSCPFSDFETCLSSVIVIVGCICVPLSLLITSSIYPVISLFRCCVGGALSFEVLRS